MKRLKILAVSVALALVGVLACAGCANTDSKTSEVVNKPTVLDPSSPVQIELWTYYNGTQQQAFEELVKSFNESRGKELGVIVVSSSQGGVNDLATAVTNSAQELVGAAAMPDAFLSYPDTASVIDGLGRVADLSGYLTEEEKSRYVESFLQEGDINGNGGLKVFPVGKSTETLQINMTDWTKFAQATGSSLDELATVEGITAVSKRYYEWTDAATPDVVGDGRPFFGRDAMANYLITGSKQLGVDLLNVKDGTCTVNLDRAAMKRMWDNYYVPIVQGWFTDEGKFRSDAMKMGNLVCYVGSSSSVVYFPKTVTVDDQTSYSIEMGALPNPVFEGGTPCAPQQGAGFVVTKSDEKKELACVEFLKWFSAKEQSTHFSLSAGYLPVTKDALTLENLEAAAQSMGESAVNYRVNMPATLETVNGGLYASLPFKGGVEARAVLEKTLFTQAQTDRKAVVAAIEAGTDPAMAVEPYVQDAVFDAWFNDLSTQLKTSIANK